MTQTWKLMAVGTTAAAALALAIGTASARAAKVIIIRDGSVELETDNAQVHPKPPDRFKHNTDITATRVEVYQDNNPRDACQNQIASIPFQAPNVLRVLVSEVRNNPQPVDPVAFFFNVDTHREQAGSPEITSLSFGKRWRFLPPKSGNRWRLVDSDNNDFSNFRIREVQWLESPNSSNIIRLAHGGKGRHWLCVKVIQEE